MERMQRDMDRMVAKAERHQGRLEQRLERQKRRMERKARKLAREEGRRASVEIVVEGDPAEDAYEEYEAEPGPNLDEERLSILRMLEQGQIAPEEAEMLLDALQ
jgi:nucleotide-binding universal stress UspA family protein